MGASGEDQVGLPLDSVLGRMSGLVIGTAALALAGPTTSLAGLPASSVVHLRMSTQVGATTPVTFHAREVILVLVVVLLQVDLDGNLVIGFAAGKFIKLYCDLIICLIIYVVEQT